MILLVEDNQVDIDLTLRAFKKNDIQHPVQVVKNGAEALDYLLTPDQSGQYQPLPTVMLLDLNLPKVSGLEVLRRVRSEPRTRTLPVVILTSSDEERDLTQSYELGANSYVRKPVSFTDFCEAARYLGVYWLILNQPPPETVR